MTIPDLVTALRSKLDLEEFFALACRLDDDPHELGEAVAAVAAELFPEEFSPPDPTHDKEPSP